MIWSDCTLEMEGQLLQMTHFEISYNFCAMKWGNFSIKFTISWIQYERLSFAILYKSTVILSKWISFFLYVLCRIFDDVKLNRWQYSAILRKLISLSIKKNVTLMYYELEKIVVKISKSTFSSSVAHLKHCKQSFLFTNFSFSYYKT